MTNDLAHCKEMFTLLSEYLDLELPEDTCEQLREHIAACPPCVEFAESLRKSIELCREYQPSTGPAGLSESAKQDLQLAWRQALSRSKARL